RRERQGGEEEAEADRRGRDVVRSRVAPNEIRRGVPGGDEEGQGRRPGAGHVEEDDTGGLADEALRGLGPEKGGADHRGHVREQEELERPHRRTRILDQSGDTTRSRYPISWSGRSGAPRGTPNRMPSDCFASCAAESHLVEKRCHPGPRRRGFSRAVSTSTMRRCGKK